MNAHFLRQFFICNFKIQERKPHPFYSKLLLFDITVAVSLPKLFIMLQIIFVEQVEIIYTSFLQLQSCVKFLQSGLRIGLKIPKSMVEIEKKMLILHATIYDEQFLHLG